MSSALRAFFGARGQLGVGIFVFVLSVAVWIRATQLVPGAAAPPWAWRTSGVVILHASMFALVLAAYAIIVTALGYRKTEHVEAKVVENIEEAEQVNVAEQRVSR